jgi:hypothetical protein
MKKTHKKLQTAIKLIQSKLHSTVRMNVGESSKAKDGEMKSVALSEFIIVKENGKSTTKSVCPSPKIDSAVAFLRKAKQWPMYVEYKNGVLFLQEAAIEVAKAPEPTPEPTPEPEPVAEPEPEPMAEKPKRTRKKKVSLDDTETRGIEDEYEEEDDAAE